MAIEEERKFLPANDDWRSSVTKREHIIQGYLARDENSTSKVVVNEDWRIASIVIEGKDGFKFEHRIKTEDGRKILELCGDSVSRSRDGAVVTGYLTKENKLATRIRLKIDSGEAFLTIKGPKSGTGVPEFEYDDLDLRDAFELKVLCGKWVIDKVRNEVPFHGIWEVDEFQGALSGRIMAEREAKDGEDISAVKIPEWAGQEVTDEPGYSNLSLCEFGFPVAAQKTCKP